MQLHYHFSPGLIPSLSHLKVSLNGTLFATLPVITPPLPPPSAWNYRSKRSQRDNESLTPFETKNNALLEATLHPSREMLVPTINSPSSSLDTTLSDCEDPSHTDALEPRRSHDDHSNWQVRCFLCTTISSCCRYRSTMPPLTFTRSVSIVFLSQPSPKALQAAGIVASWFGILTDSRPVRFPVSLAPSLPATPSSSARTLPIFPPP